MARVNRTVKVNIIFLLTFLTGLILVGSAGAAPNPQIGVFLPDRTPQAISNHQSQVGRHQDIIMFYQAWGFNGGELDTERVQWIINNGSTPMITWEPWAWGQGVNQPDYRLSKISGGTHDIYIRSFAQSVKQINGLIYLRPMHEMNGDWYPWAGTANGNQPGEYVPAFRHIVDIFRQEGVANVRWVWSPNNAGLPDWGSSFMQSYYPGDNYVDFAAIDGYNYGTEASWSRWTSFADIFDRAYRTITGFTQKPIIITEMSSAETGGNKAAWIRDAYSKVRTAYPKIVALIWFNERKEADWRAESSAQSLAAYKEALAGQSRPPGRPSDSAPPTGGIAINRGAARTKTRRVTLGLRGADAGGSGLSRMRLKNGARAWGPWQRFSPTKRWTLTSGRGNKRVFLQLKDSAGNVSRAYRDAVALTRPR